MRPDSTVCGWRVRSDFPIPELTEWHFGDRAPDIRIIRANTDDSISYRDLQPLSVLTSLSAAGDWVIQVPQIGRFQVREGREVTVAPESPGDERELSALLLGPVLAAICRQRRLLTLRATTMGYDDFAIALCGEAGIGKSAVGYNLARYGCRLISDGMTVIDASAANETPGVLATHRTFYLWRAAVESLRIPAGSAVRSRASINKYSCSGDPAAFDALGVLPLRHIFILSRRDTRISVVATEGDSSAERRLANQLYIDEGYDGSLTRKEILALCVSVCAAVPVRILPVSDGAQPVQEILRLLGS